MNLLVSQTNIGRVIKKLKHGLIMKIMKDMKDIKMKKNILIK